MARLGWRLIVTAVLLFPWCGPVLAGEPARIEHVGMVAPNVIGITIMAGRAEYGRQMPYEKQAGDILLDPQMHRFVRRGDKIIGTLAGKNADILCTMDSVVGERFDTKWADRPNSYSVTSADDPHYATAQAPNAVFRKSKPSDLAMTGQYKFDSPTENVVYLVLPAPLASGRNYEISFPGGGFGSQKFAFDATRLRSEAVHVNQVGFRPDDPAKTAFLSCWLGNGGGLKYEARLPFSVIDETTGKAVFEGATTLSKAATDKTEDAYKKNYNGTDVYEMDFTALTQPGKYRVSVRAVGCSHPFEIADHVWRNAFIVAARGFYHQRSGIAIGEPYTTFKRPRPFHPDDGLKVYASTAPLMDTGNGINQKDSNFDSLEQYDSAWVYARTDRPGIDDAVKQCCRLALLKAGEERAASGGRTAFHWIKNPYGPVVYGALSSPENAVNIVRAHVLTGDPKYLRALVLASQTGAGANPVNMCYTTGLGVKSPRHPLQLDSRITLQPPPPGLTVGGPMDNDMNGIKDPFIGPFAGSLFCPPYTQWPALEAFWDVFWDPMQCEYTIQKPMAGHAYVWGYLAARAPLAKPKAP